jgi:multiple antibiotic resistance protein
LQPRDQAIVFARRLIYNTRTATLFGDTMLADAALTSFIAALLSMMNPIGNIGLFAGLTAHQSPAESRKTAMTCAIASAITLLLMAWAGQAFLNFFGLSVDTMRAAGGIIVLRIGLGMLSNDTQHQGSPAEHRDARSRASLGVVPLAIPIVAGPGTMATVLVATQQESNVLGNIEISVVIVAMATATGLLFCFAAPLSKRLGAAGMGVVTRVMGMVLSAIAIGMLAQGLAGLLPGLAG